MTISIGQRTDLKLLGQKEKWDLLSPHLRRHGREALSYATLQEGMEYYLEDAGTRFFFRLSERYGNDIYNFRGLSFHKSKYRTLEKPPYFVSNALLPSSDVDLAFLSADISRSCFSTVGRLLRGMATALRPGRSV